MYYYYLIISLHVIFIYLFLFIVLHKQTKHLCMRFNKLSANVINITIILTGNPSILPMFTTVLTILDLDVFWRHSTLVSDCWVY